MNETTKRAAANGGSSACLAYAAMYLATKFSIPAEVAAGVVGFVAAGFHKLFRKLFKDKK